MERTKTDQNLKNPHNHRKNSVLIMRQTVPIRFKKTDHLKSVKPAPNQQNLNFSRSGEYEISRFSPVKNKNKL